MCFDPRIWPGAFRPQKTPCEAGKISYPRDESNPQAAPNFNRLLDIANDGTFSGARRAATLGHQNPDDTLRAISGLARASQDGRLTEGYAADRIAELADPVLAAQQAEQRVRPLTPDELALQRARRAAGLSDSTVEAARDARLAEACRPRVCFIEKDTKGRPVARTTIVGITREQAMQFPGFLRFCTDDEIRGEAGLSADEPWGEWAIFKLQKAAAGVGLVDEPPPLEVRSAIRRSRVTVADEPVAVRGEPGKKYLCLDPRVLPPAFRPYDNPCTAPLIPYPGT